MFAGLHLVVSYLFVASHAYIIDRILKVRPNFISDQISGLTALTEAYRDEAHRCSDRRTAGNGVPHCHCS